jgi:hypothetical protein
MDGMNQAGKMGDEISAVYQEMAQSQQGKPSTEEDIKLQYLAAKSGIEIDTKQKLADIAVGKASISHAQRTEQRKQQGITQLALQKAKARAEIQKTMAKAKPMQEAPEVPEMEEEEEPEMEEEEETEEVEVEEPEEIEEMKGVEEEATQPAPPQTT